MLSIGLKVGLALLGLAHSPDLPFQDWMSSLQRPDAPGSCCGPADQYWVRRYEASAGGFRAEVIGREGGADFWTEVPQNKVIWDRANPTGRGVIFIRTFDMLVLCFVPGTGA